MSHDWELSKENVIPIKRGRAVQDLSNPLKSSQNTELTFESSISDNFDNAEGLLSAYIQYYTWIRRRAGDNKASAKSLLERSTNDLLRFKQLANNIQYVKLWIEYADLVSDPNDVFSFMQTNGVGVKMSLFWIAWAFIAEKGENYQLADRIFQNGLCENAEPKALLSQRYQQFQRRITRKYLTAMENGETFTPLSSTVASSAAKPTTSVIPPTSTTTSIQSSSFAVFNDADDGGNNFLMPAIVPKKNRSFLANENQRLKENIGVVEKWTNPILPPAANLVNNSLNITIFTDPDCAPPPVPPQNANKSSFLNNNNTKNEHSAVVASHINNQPKPTTSFSIPIFDDSAVSSAAISKKEEEPPTTVAPVNNIAHNKLIVEDTNEDQTINTKLALEDIEKMFTEEDFFASLDKIRSNDDNSFTTMSVCDSCRDHNQSTNHSSHSQEYVELEEYFSNRRRKFYSLPSVLNQNQLYLTTELVSLPSVPVQHNNDNNNNHSSALPSSAATDKTKNIQNTHNSCSYDCNYNNSTSNYDCEFENSITKKPRTTTTTSASHLGAQLEHNNRSSLDSSSILDTMMYTDNMEHFSHNDHRNSSSNYTRKTSSSVQKAPSSSDEQVTNISDRDFIAFQRRWYEEQASSLNLHDNTHLRPQQILAQMGKKIPTFATATVCLQGTQWTLHQVLARGKFGIAVQLVSNMEKKANDHHSQNSRKNRSRHSVNDSNRPRYCVMKIDKEHYSVHWEVTVHRLIKKRSELQQLAEESRLPWLPAWDMLLFADCSAIFLPYVGKFTLISLLQLLKRRGFEPAEHEILVAMVALQMLNSVRRLHALEFLHCDIKSDNWVMEILPSALYVYLIDFGKARPMSMDPNKEDTRLCRFFKSQPVYSGQVSARVYRSASEKSEASWSYSVDYHGLCCCLHQLLFLDDLRITQYTPAEAEKRGFLCSNNPVFPQLCLDEHKEGIFLPTSGLRRYWHKEAWTLVFAALLNPPDNLREQARLQPVIYSLQTFLQSNPSLVEHTTTKICKALISMSQFL